MEGPSQMQDVLKRVLPHIATTPIVISPYEQEFSYASNETVLCVTQNKTLMHKHMDRVTATASTPDGLFWTSSGSLHVLPRLIPGAAPLTASHQHTGETCITTAPTGPVVAVTSPLGTSLHRVDIDGRAITPQPAPMLPGYRLVIDTTGKRALYYHPENVHVIVVDISGQEAVESHRLNFPGPVMSVVCCDDRLVIVSDAMAFIYDGSGLTVLGWFLLSASSPSHVASPLPDLIPKDQITIADAHLGSFRVFKVDLKSSPSLLSPEIEEIEFVLPHGEISWTPDLISNSPLPSDCWVAMTGVVGGSTLVTFFAPSINGQYLPRFVYAISSYSGIFPFLPRTNFSAKLGDLTLASAGDNTLTLATEEATVCATAAGIVAWEEAGHVCVCKDGVVTKSRHDLGEVSHIAVNSTRLAICSREKISVYASESLHLIREIDVASALSLFLHPASLVAVLADGRIAMASLTTGAVSWLGKVDCPLNSVCFDPTGMVILSRVEPTTVVLLALSGIRLSSHVCGEDSIISPHSARTFVVRTVQRALTVMAHDHPSTSIIDTVILNPKIVSPMHSIVSDPAVPWDLLINSPANVEEPETPAESAKPVQPRSFARRRRARRVFDDDEPADPAPAPAQATTAPTTTAYPASFPYLPPRETGLVESVFTQVRKLPDIDDFGRSYLVALGVALFSRTELGSSPVPDSAVLAAGLSADSSRLVASVFPAYSPLTIEDFELTRVAEWATDSDLESLVTRFVVDEFHEHHDVNSVAAYYIAMDKITRLASVYSTSGNAKVSSFLRNDFTAPRWRQAAGKNAFALLGKLHFVASAGFFLLAGQVDECRSICRDRIQSSTVEIILMRLSKNDIDTFESADMIKSWRSGHYQPLLDALAAQPTSSSPVEPAIRLAILRALSANHPLSFRVNQLIDTRPPQLRLLAHLATVAPLAVWSCPEVKDVTLVPAMANIVALTAQENTLGLDSLCEKLGVDLDALFDFTPPSARAVLRRIPQLRNRFDEYDMQQMTVIGVECTNESVRSYLDLYDAIKTLDFMQVFKLSNLEIDHIPEDFLLHKMILIATLIRLRKSDFVPSASYASMGITLSTQVRSLCDEISYNPGMFEGSPVWTGVGKWARLNPHSSQLLRLVGEAIGLDEDLLDLLDSEAITSILLHALNSQTDSSPELAAELDVGAVMIDKVTHAALLRQHSGLLLVTAHKDRVVEYIISQSNQLIELSSRRGAGHISCLAASPSSPLYATAAGMVLSLWVPGVGQPLMTKRMNSAVVSVAFDISGRRLAVLLEDMVIVFRLDSNPEIDPWPLCSIPFEVDDGALVLFESASRVIVVSSEAVSIYDVLSGTHLAHADLGTCPVYHALVEAIALFGPVTAAVRDTERLVITAARGTAVATPPKFDRTCLAGVSDGLLLTRLPGGLLCHGGKVASAVLKMSG
ncbi:RAVE protein 1 C terminal [Carpediemonas membranifera]|uniref:RAVE protein 1 C terminal n=1 Tax=Carpediemonas membranifera TaxID=201153 RepID=A0A8J6B1X8_9EUKA|nr:RAVE protein 1 C terminal [Carpediemonas membranifera]|eukprot:KAG9392524.1 RAVE protein 1 C terminal [Carpediemonas membranifera]